MKLYNLQAGYIVVTREDTKYLILPLSGEISELFAYSLEDSSRSSLNKWDINMYNKAGVSGDDIVEVHAIENFQDLLIIDELPTKLLWKRPNQAELMGQLQELMLQMQGVLELLT